MFATQKVLSRRFAGRREGATLVRAVAASQKPIPLDFRNKGVSDPYAKLRGLKVTRVADGAVLDLTSLWGPEERAVVMWTRTMGCPFCQALASEVAEDVIPALNQMGTKLFLVSIGTPETGHKFSALTGFPSDLLLADPEGVTYAALGLNKTVQKTFFSIETPLSLVSMALGPKSGARLANALKRWIPFQPPHLDQAMQQGGVLVFDGASCSMGHYDPATASHADISLVLDVVRNVKSKADACTSACELPLPPSATRVV